MLNSATHRLDDAAGDSSAWSPGLDVDRRPALRLVVLYGLFVLVAGGVAARVAQVQLTLHQGFARERNQTVEKIEILPSHSGRIAAADGTILAQDVPVFSVAMHYRRLERPAEEGWLKQQARQRLSRAERRDPERVAQEIKQVEAEQAAAWERLVVLSGVELDQRRAKIQHRVERIKTAVLRNRAAKRQTPTPAPVRRTDAPWWQQMSEDLLATLTTPPEREAEEPLIIQEELEYHPLLPDVPLAIAAEIEAHPERYPGLRITRSTRRVYPERDLAAHLVGSRTPLDAEAVAARQARLSGRDPLDYQVGDWIGRTGVERFYEQQLRGLRGEQKITLNRRGEVLSTEMLRRPLAGRTLVLAMHAGLQRQAEQMLDTLLAGPVSSESEEPPPIPQGGSIVVLDVRNGELVVGASAPRYDLNLPLNGDAAAWAAVNADPRQPFFPRMTRAALPPGSIFKAVTATALLESGRWDPDEPRYCQGFLDHSRSNRCYVFRHFGQGHADMTLNSAIAQSCNVYFFMGARKLGPAPIYDWAQRLGFGAPTGIDLPGEKSGHLPLPPGIPAPPGVKPELRYPGDTLGLAIGQSTVSATPLQVARMMAAIANGGRLVTPHIVRDIGENEAGSQTDSRLTHSRPIPDLRPETVERLREGLEQVVAHPSGTGYKSVRLAEVRIAGKTGTAEVGIKPDHAWFAGFVPADRPRYAFVVVLEHAGSGGRTAGPVARELVRAMHDAGLLD